MSTGLLDDLGGYYCRGQLRVGPQLFEQGCLRAGEPMCMRLTVADFRSFLARDPAADEAVALGDALQAVAVDVESDAVEAVRDARVRV